MSPESIDERALLEKIRTLPPEKIAAVADFVDFLRERQSDRALTQAAMRVSEDSFRRVWDNAEDAVYDDL
jgi:hypothetical protein